jgi:hypothetical protein
MTDIVVEIRGGVVADVYSRRPGVRVTIVDWDNMEEGNVDTCVAVVRCTPRRRLPRETARLIRATGRCQPEAQKAGC